MHSRPQLKEIATEVTGPFFLQFVIGYDVRRTSLTKNTSSSTGVWARVGQIAVILTALWTILQIYTYFYSKDAQIEATAEFGAFSPPDAWVQQLLT